MNKAKFIWTTWRHKVTPSERKLYSVSRCELKLANSIVNMPIFLLSISEKSKRESKGGECFWCHTPTCTLDFTSL